MPGHDQNSGSRSYLADTVVEHGKQINALSREVSEANANSAMLIEAEKRASVQRGAMWDAINAMRSEIQQAVMALANTQGAMTSANAKLTEQERMLREHENDRQQRIAVRNLFLAIASRGSIVAMLVALGALALVGAAVKYLPVLSIVKQKGGS